jgi:hypothetical protein
MWWFRLATGAALAGGCGAGSAQLALVGAQKATDPRSLKAAVASEAYGCAFCSGTRVELSLYREGEELGSAKPSTYHLHEVFYGSRNGDRVVDTNGTWLEPPVAPGEALVVELESGRPDGRLYFARAERNGGELVQLDAKLRELAANVPHTLTRVSGDHQMQTLLLGEGDDGRTLELKAGEVFLLRLRTGMPAGYTWSSDRPASMALLETDGDGSVPPASPGASAAPVASLPPAKIRPQGTRVRSARTVPAAKLEYQVWELIAPPPGVQLLQFQYRYRSKDRIDLPVKVFRLTVITR